MPTHRNLTISLQSQYDFLPIPETLSPSSRHPTPNTNRTITANIPTYSNSQFWLLYSCPLPPPPKPGGEESKYYYFKLFVSGKCILSWGVGEAEGWEGKVVCGFWDGGTDFEGRSVVERRGLFFPGNEEGGSGYEVKVYRAKARKREEVKYERFDERGERENGMKFTTTGRKKKGERQRYYTYALVDPKEAPFVTFRYWFASKEQLLRLENEDADDEEVEEAFSSLQSRRPSESPTPRSGMDLTPPSPLETRSRRQQPRRLSFPPRANLLPSAAPAKATRPPSPIKRKPVSSDGAQLSASTKATAPNISASGRRLRTPSPPTGSRNAFSVSPGTPPSQRKAESSGLLKSVVASALKRREHKTK